MKKEDELEEDEESDLFGSESMSYQPRDRSFKEQGFFVFRTSQSLGDPADPLYFLFKDVPDFHETSL